MGELWSVFLFSLTSGHYWRHFRNTSEVVVVIVMNYVKRCMSVQCLPELADRYCHIFDSVYDLMSCLAGTESYVTIKMG